MKFEDYTYRNLERYVKSYWIIEEKGGKKYGKRLV